MQRFSSFLAAGWSMTPHSLRSLLTFVALPIVVPVLLYRMIRETDWKAMSVQGIKYSALQKQLIVTELEQDSAAAQKADIAQQTRTLLDAQNFDGFCQELWEVDQTGRKADDGGHFSKEMMSTVWDHITYGIPKRTDECGDTYLKPIPFERIEPFIDAANDHPENPAINALAAWLCLEIGWIYRGGGYADTVSQAQFQKMHDAFQTSSVFLERFDVDTANSPMLARVTYHHLAGIQTTLQELNATFDACMRLDPDDTVLMSQHAFHLLPRWYGHYDILEEQARKAYARTHLERGATDYAAFYLDQIERDDGALATVDIELLEQGVRDWVAWSDVPQLTLNTLLNKSSIAAESRSGFASTPHIVKTQRKQLRDMFHRLVKSELKAVAYARWDRNRRDVLYTFANAFASELHTGETVHIGDTSTA